MQKFIIISFLIILLLSAFFIDTFHVTGDSMYPEFTEGDLIITVKPAFFIHKIRKGDDVVFNSPVTGKLNLKRCLAVDNNEVFLTGINLPESTDSRHYGRIALNDIKGWVWIKI